VDEMGNPPKYKKRKQEMNLAYIGQVTQIYPIPDADFIESLEVVCGPGGRWRGTAKKGDFAPGDLCEVYLQDTLLPQSERFAFMEKHRWRIKMMRTRGVPSECLIMPLTEVTSNLEVGTNITDITGVTKYEKQIPAHLSGDIKGSFPSFIPKTDEPNFQKVPEMVLALHNQRFFATVKADGSSGTIFHDGQLRCCSRNYELKKSPSSAIWQIAHKYDLETKLKDSGVALQFEIVGPGIQKNPLGLKTVDMRLFQVWDIANYRYFSFGAYRYCGNFLQLPMVDIVSSKVFNPNWNDEDLRLMAQVKYPNGKHAEGIVLRPMLEERVNGERLSFKIINLLYKD
jgi:RNA ligase (TIGR02306 family)